MSNVKPLRTQSNLGIILLVEDDSARSKRRPVLGLRRSQSDPTVTIRVHRIVDGEWRKVYRKAQLSRRQEETGTRGYRQAGALELLSGCNITGGPPIIVAGASYGCSSSFIKSLVEKRLDFVLEIRPSHQVEFAQCGKQVKQRAADVLGRAVWRDVEVAPRQGKSSIRYSVTELAEVCLPGDTTGRLFAAQTGGIEGLHSGTIIGLTSLRATTLEDLVRYIGWVRWIRPLVRRQERNSHKPSSLSQGEEARKNEHGLMLRYRSNITLARLQDESSEGDSNVILSGSGPRGVTFAGANVLNVVELFAGAGGMGLGFLMAEHPMRRFRLVFAGELHPIYIQTLRTTHDCLVGMQESKWGDFVPESLNRSTLTIEDTRTRRIQGKRGRGCRHSGWRSTLPRILECEPQFLVEN